MSGKYSYGNKNGRVGLNKKSPGSEKSLFYCIVLFERNSKL